MFFATGRELLQLIVQAGTLSTRAVAVSASAFLFPLSVSFCQRRRGTEFACRVVPLIVLHQRRDRRENIFRKRAREICLLIGSRSFRFQDLRENAEYLISPETAAVDVPLDVSDGRGGANPHAINRVNSFGKCGAATGVPVAKSSTRIKGSVAKNKLPTSHGRVSAHPAPS